MTEMFGEAWSPMSVPDLAPDDDDDGVSESLSLQFFFQFAKYFLKRNTLEHSSQSPIFVIVIYF